MTIIATRYITQIFTASVSFIASSAMSIIIFKSPKGLKSPYRRILFGISCSDILQSLAIIAGPFASPNESTSDIIAPWSRGTGTTCAINGFVITNAINFVPMYTCSLCIYYLFKLQWRMADDTFLRRVEWILHLAVFLVNIPLSITALALDSFHATSLGVCYYNEYPPGCRTLGNKYYGKCEKGLTSSPFLFAGIIIPAVCYLGIMFCAVILCRHAFVRTKDFRAKMSMEPATVANEPGNVKHSSKKSDITQATDEEVPSSPPPQPKKAKLRLEQTSRAINLSNRQSHETKVQYLSRLYRKEILTQALLFVLCFTVVNFMPFLTFVESLLSYDNHANTFNNNNAAAMVMAILFPLGGLFNILVYCRPKVAALRRRENKDGNSTIAWMKGFVMVVAAGGEIPEVKDAKEINPIQNEQLSKIENPNQLSSGLSWYKSNESFIDDRLVSSSERRSANESWDEYDHIYRGDGMEWFTDYRIEEETFHDITYGRNFDTENMSGLSLEEEE